MTFERLHARLLDAVRHRVHNGELTERGLARLTGVSQSHMHNVLKGVRVLTNPLADQILLQLKMDVLELTGNSLPEIVSIRNIPLMVGLLGQGSAAFEPGRTLGSICVPSLMAAGLWRPVMARLGSDDQARPRFEARDLVLIDQAVRPLSDLQPDAVYVVDTALGARLRYLRNGTRRLYLTSETCRHRPEHWAPSCSGAIKGRVIWVTREN